jgi:hypothetical protein
MAATRRSRHVKIEDKPSVQTPSKKTRGRPRKSPVSSDSPAKKVSKRGLKKAVIKKEAAPKEESFFDWIASKIFGTGL